MVARFEGASACVVSGVVVGLWSAVGRFLAAVCSTRAAGLASVRAIRSRASQFIFVALLASVQAPNPQWPGTPLRSYLAIDKRLCVLVREARRSLVDRI